MNMSDTTPRRLNDLIGERKDTALLAAVVVVPLIAIVVASLGAGSHPFPSALGDRFPFADWVNDGEEWRTDN